jgi:DNA repair protein RecO (recombination protein O)
MFTHYRTPGFILKKTDKGESDRVFTVYTEEFGKLELLAKAERKITSKLRGGLEVFCLSEIEFIQGKKQKTLTDAVLLNNFKEFKKDFRVLGVLFKMAEVSDSLIREAEAEEKIWQLFKEVFQKLKDHKPELVYYYFFWNLVSFLGYQPELHHCVSCKKKLSPEAIYFHPKESSFVCRACNSAKDLFSKISPDAIKIIRLILKKDWKTMKKLKLEKQELESLKEISKLYFLALSEHFK